MAARKEVKFVPAITWDVQLKNICIEGETDVIENQHALVRDDNKKVLSVFKHSYKPCLNKDFTATAERISNLTKFQIEGYQEINNGKRVLAYLKNNDPNFRLVGEPVDDYMVIGNSHDGSTSLFLGNSNTIIRCMNQFGSIMQNLRIRHTASMDQKLELAIADIEEYFRKVERMGKTFEKFREIKIDKNIIHALTERLFDLDHNHEISDRKAAKMLDFKESVDQEIDALGTNFWGLFNGVTHFTTHKVSSKNPTLGNFWGQSGKMNDQAMKFGLEMLDKKKSLILV